MALWKGKKDSKEVFISLEISHWIFLENPLHISPEVRGQTVSLKAMVDCDSRKIAQNRTGVKRDFRLPFRTIFQTQDRKGNHNLLGVAAASQKLRLPASSLNSKPLSLFARYTLYYDNFQNP